MVWYGVVWCFKLVQEVKTEHDSFIENFIGDGHATACTCCFGFIRPSYRSWGQMPSPMSGFACSSNEREFIARFGDGNLNCYISNRSRRNLGKELPPLSIYT